MLNNLNFSVGSSPWALAPLVAGTGFVDGIHPCAIAILIFFIAFLLTLHRSFKKVAMLGVVYIAVIFLTYLGIGIGFFSGVMLFGRHHFMAEAGSWLLIILGVINIFNYFAPKSKINLHLPKVSNDKIRGYLKKATLPTVILGAFLVGLCSVPCSGGVYAAITALLAGRTTFFTGFLYLILYNLMFVAPLIIILILAGNPLTLVKFGQWQQKHKENQKLVMGLFMLLIGLAILLFFI